MHIHACDKNLPVPEIYSLWHPSGKLFLNFYFKPGGGCIVRRTSFFF